MRSWRLGAPDIHRLRVPRADRRGGGACTAYSHLTSPFGSANSASARRWAPMWRGSCVLSSGEAVLFVAAGVGIGLFASWRPPASSSPCSSRSHLPIHRLTRWSRLRSCWSRCSRAPFQRGARRASIHVRRSRPTEGPVSAGRGPRSGDRERSARASEQFRPRFDHQRLTPNGAPRPYTADTLHRTLSLSTAPRGLSLRNA